MAGGLAASALYQDLSFSIQLGRFLEATSVLAFAVSLFKSAVFGVAIAAVSCWQGLAVDRSVNAVPIAAMNAVVQSLLAVFLFDALFAYLRFVVF